MGQQPDQRKQSAPSAGRLLTRQVSSDIQVACSQMSEFVEYLPEIFLEFGSVSARKMFGGHGIFFDGLMIGLVANDMLYLKADNQSAARFTENGLSQFQYPKGDKLVGMSYYLAPEEALEDPSEMREWAQLAYEAALRARK